MNFFKDKKLMILGIILVLGIFLRFYNLSTNPASVYWDEAAIALDAYSLNKTGKDMNNLHWFQAVFPSYGDFKAPVFIWLVTLSMKIFGYGVFAVRFPIAFFSSLLIITSYFLVKEMLSFDEKLEKKYKLLPLFTAFIVSINPWSVHFGRIGLESGLSVFWFALAILLFLKGVKKSGFYLVLASLSASFGVYTYYSLRVVAPFLFLSLGILFFKKIWKKVSWGILAIIVFLGLNLPIFKSRFYDLSQNYRLNNDNLIRPVKVIEESSKYLEKYNSSLISRILYHRYTFWTRDYLKNYFSHFSFDFLFFNGDSNLRQHSGYGGEFLFILLPFYLIGLYFLMKNWKSIFAKIVFFLSIFSPIAAAMVYEIPHASRSVYLFLPISIIIGFGINLSINYLNKKNKLIYFIFGIFLILNLGTYYFDYFGDYPKRSSKNWIYAYYQIGDWLKNNHQNYSNIEIDGGYWMPELYVFYHFPDLILTAQDLKNAMINNNLNTFGIPNPFGYLLEPHYFVGDKKITKPRARFLNPEKKELEGYKLVEEFKFLDGEPSLNLFIEDKNE